MKVPILKLKNILLTSIQVELTDEDAIEFQNDVLNKVISCEAEGVVIDISSMEIVDSYMARVLSDTVNMVQLLGTQTVICGIQPDVALTLIEMGRELLGVKTALNLDKGIEILEGIMKKQEVKS
ncbi:STAS domain-containing protein [Deltaproteobacteria bacterium TL4]